ncbi:MAG: hypothetical protein ACLFQA_03965, partial [Bacteroidales bacterium]
MKNPSLFLLFISSIILISCEKDQIREFSCDPSIDEYVKENRLKLSATGIFELASYDIEVQRAVFRSWDYEIKREVWIEKLLFVMDNEGFTTPEAKHVQDLIDHITGDYFIDEPTLDNPGVRSRFAGEWIDYASKELAQYFPLVVAGYGRWNVMEIVTS